MSNLCDIVITDSGHVGLAIRIHPICGLSVLMGLISEKQAVRFGTVGALKKGVCFYG